MLEDAESRSLSFENAEEPHTSWTWRMTSAGRGSVLSIRLQERRPSGRRGMRDSLLGVEVNRYVRLQSFDRAGPTNTEGQSESAFAAVGGAR